MKETIHQQQCCVVFPARKSELFYMNMRVYRVESADELGFVPPGSNKLIWCAVCRPDDQRL